MQSFNQRSRSEKRRAPPPPERSASKSEGIWKPGNHEKRRITAEAAESAYRLSRVIAFSVCLRALEGVRFSPISVHRDSMLRLGRRLVVRLRASGQSKYLSPHEKSAHAEKKFKVSDPGHREAELEIGIRSLASFQAIAPGVLRAFPDHDTRFQKWVEQVESTLFRNAHRFP